jgi:hypothetical protein
MSDPTYRIPTTGLYLEPDGTLVPKPKSGATVVDATEALATKLSAAYVGKGLQLMGGSSEAGDGVAIALEELGDAAEGIVLVGDVIELGLKIAEFLGAFPHKKDPVIAKLERIDAHLNSIEDLVLASWADSRRQQLAILRAQSATSLQIAMEYLDQNQPQSAVWANKIAQAEFNSLFAVNVFTQSGVDGGLWLRPFSLKANGLSQVGLTGTPYYNQSWGHFHPDRQQILTDPGRPVWDYRFALPATVYAMVSRLAVLKAVAPRSLQMGESGCREMRAYVRFLRSVVQRIQNGMWATQELPTDQISQFLFGWNGWSPVAAAQIDSGYGFARAVYAYEWTTLHRADPPMWPAGLSEPFAEGRTPAEVRDLTNENVRRTGSHWWSLVWRDIGMMAMCRIISDLDRACAPRVFWRLIGDAQKRLIMASTDVTSARVASGLAYLTSAGDAADDSGRTFRLYESLRSGNPAVRQALIRATDELLALTPQEEPPSRPAPVGWWRGENDARDAVGGNDGRVVGTVRFVAGRAGHSFAFSEGGYVEIPNARVLEPETITLAAWVRRDAPPSEPAYLLSKGANACIAASYALYTGQTGGLFFYVSDGRTIDYSSDAGREIWDNSWHFVVGSYDGEFVRLFIDGHEVGTPTPATVEEIGYRLPDGDSLYLGAYRGTCESRFDGAKLDEVRLFDRALTGAQIANLYTSER